ncbi:MAG: protein kinase [Anaerolineae bacterium]|nr:protein kinase [Anaerolineae bacterium]
MTQPLPIGTEVKNRYRIVRLVGGGGMAWVYQVEELPAGSGKLWALKELRPQTEDRAEQAAGRKLFVQEARWLRELDHPNIPKIADFFEEDGRSYLVMEFIFGESLEKRLKAANAPLLESDVLNWALQLCDALHYLHTRTPPIIFRDIKPSNAMVTNTGQVKLIDFGIARTYKTGKKRDTVAMGSENYAAPEQWGKGQTDARSDVYALGATIYDLLANMAPTPAFLPSEPLPLANYNGAVSAKTIAVVEKAMQRDREARFQSILDMRQAIVAALPASQLVEPVAPPVAAAPQPAAPVPEPSSSSETPPTPAQPRPKAQPEPQPIRPAPAPAQHKPRPVLAPAPPPKPCPACGRPNKPGARYCAGCGHSFVPLQPAILRIVEPVRAAWEMPVARSPMLLGRASQAEGYWPDFDMTFYDEDEGYVSRRHAQISRGPDGYFITDLDSYNGTTVNGQSLLPQRAHPLRNGDRIQVGLVVIEFRLR